MQKADSIKNIAKALALFHVKVDTIKKDAKNPFFKSSYASLPNILDAINEPLIECDLSLAQFPSGENGLTTILMHSSGEWMQAEYQMRPAKDDPQGRGSAITYQRRYAIASILCLNIDEDDDANLATHGRANPDDKQWLNAGTEQFKSALAYIQNGGTIDKIKEKYKISKDVEKLLNK
jgi:hypothetical protein